MKNKFKSVVALVLAVSFIIGISIPAKASGPDYSKYECYDGFNMKAELYLKYIESQSNGKTEKQNRGTKDEFENVYYSFTEPEKLDDGRYITMLCAEQKDEANSGAETVKRMLEVGVGTATQVNKDLNTALDELTEYGLLSDNAKDSKKIKTGINSIVALNTFFEVKDAYTANRFKWYVTYECDKNGKINKDAYPLFMFGTRLYSNHEDEFVDGEMYTVESRAFTFTSNNQPVYYHFKTVLFEENGLTYWGYTFDGVNYKY